MYIVYIDKNMSLFGINQDQEYHSNHLQQQQPARSSFLPQDQQQQQQQQQQDHTNQANNSNENNTRDTNHHRRVRTTSTTMEFKQGQPGRPKHAAFLELLYGTILYITCIFLPSFPSYIYQTYLWSASWMNICRERILWSIWICWRFSLVILERWGWMEDPYRIDKEGMMKDDAAAAAGAVPGGIRRLGHKISVYIFSTSTASLWEEFNQQQQHREEEERPYSWGFGRTSSAHPSILMVLQDIQILVLLAVFLAVVRVWFVHMLVPEVLANPKRLEAMTRCKSSHLLSSSSYSFGGEQLSRGWDNGSSKDRVGGGSRMDLSTMNREVGTESNVGGSGRGRGWFGQMLMWVSRHWYRLRPTVRRALGHDSARYNNIVQQQQSPVNSPYRRSNSNNPITAQHLFSAPRHATATFRLLYTSVSCISALLLFQSAEFWPRSVFGTHPHASTRHCWDLSGSFSALGFLDDDYDAKNGKLKYFFLAQAAYQLHSLCFHVVSMLLLLLYGGSSGGVGSWASRLIGLFRGDGSSYQPQQSSNNNPQTKSKRLISMKTSMQSYFRPMMEHVIVLALLIGAYLFSGLRRLGAVGIFTLELSSVFLQLLQVSIYAPENSWWRKPEVVLFVHRMLTVPTFVYCRLIVLPFVLWRSALFESQEWLEQIAKVFSPGWAEKLYTMFNGSLCLIFALNLVLFRRLLFHPHLKQIVKQKGQVSR